MKNIKDRIIKLIEQNATKKVAALASEYIQAKSEEKEAIQAGIDFERWLADCCNVCL